MQLAVVLTDRSVLGGFSLQCRAGCISFLGFKNRVGAPRSAMFLVAMVATFSCYACLWADNWVDGLGTGSAGARSGVSDLSRHGEDAIDGAKDQGGMLLVEWLLHDMFDFAEKDRLPYMAVMVSIDILLHGDPFFSFRISAAATAFQRRWPLVLAVCLISDFCDLSIDLGCDIHFWGQFCNFYSYSFVICFWF